jgi:uncharacterized protein (TIGR02996 family)
MPPPGHEPFLRAICANPEDDTVRLVYADWLDENGDGGRAEFIRLQVAYRSKPEEFDPRYARMDELRKLHGQRWRNEFPTLSGVTYGQFHRGFIDTVTFRDFAAFAERGDELLWQIPASHVRLLGVRAEHVPTLLGSPFARRFTLLRVSAGAAGAAVIESLTSTEWQWSLRELSLVAWGPDAGNLHRLPLISDRLALLILRACVFPHLCRLHLGGAAVSRGVYAELSERFGRGLTVSPGMSHSAPR